ncbi:MAG: histidinol dehydrogenase [Flavobacteriales bacterium]|nr:histidinol dehydrogenase [Flavobacteriales bacterium]
MIQVIAYPETTQWKSLVQRPVLDREDLTNRVKDMLEDVRLNGDDAVLNYTRMYDYANAKSLRIEASDFKKSVENVSENLKIAIEMAILNIQKFHSTQHEIEHVIETMPGVKCWRKSVAIEKVGLYIPGGTAPLFSTLLMLTIPAQIAGCNEIVVCTPPDKNGRIAPEILYCAHRLGLQQVFACGGVQAIGAMAFGTETVPAVYKIFGPGNQYVTEAKQQIQSWGVAIDMPAGPSEVLVIAEPDANSSFIAADLLSQAEHGADSQVILLTNDEKLALLVQQELQHQINVLPRKEIVHRALKNSRCIILNNRDEMIEFSNMYAPEHLIIHAKDTAWYENRIKNAGSVFLGAYTPESAGDYASGTNHTLPTNGYARNYSGVSLDSFVRKITYQQITTEGLKALGNTIIEMARAEHLEAHAQAVEIRMNTLKQ